MLCSKYHASLQVIVKTVVSEEQSKEIEKLQILKRELEAEMSVLNDKIASEVRTGSLFHLKNVARIFSATSQCNNYC